MMKKLLSITIVLLHGLINTVNAQEKYLNFDGFDDYIQIENNLVHDFSGDFTIEMKFKRQRLGVREDLFNKKDFNNSASNSSNDIAFFITSDNKINLLLRETTSNEVLLTSSSTIDTLNWNHIACVRSSADIKFYINGVLEATGSSNKNFTSTGPLRIGSNRIENLDSNGMATFPFDGDIDEVRIWNVGRSNTEVLANQNNEMMGTETGLTSYYSFNQGINCANNLQVDTLFDVMNIINGRLWNFDLSETTSSPCHSNWNGTSTFSVGEINPNLITVFPNPVQDMLTIDFESLDLFNEINLYDNTGALLKKINKNELESNFQMDFSNYPEGCYFIRISDVNMNQVSYKVMKL